MEIDLEDMQRVFEEQPDLKGEFQDVGRKLGERLLLKHGLPGWDDIALACAHLRQMELQEPVFAEVCTMARGLLLALHVHVDSGVKH